MKKTFDIIKNILSDERGSLSSKRVIAFIIVLTLIATLVTCLIVKGIQLPDTLVTALATICVAAMASSSADKFSDPNK